MKRRALFPEKNDAKHRRSLRIDSNDKTNKPTSHTHTDQGSKPIPVYISSKRESNRETKRESKGSDNSGQLFKDLCISHIPDWISNSDLEDGLLTEFEKYGKISVKIVDESFTRLAYIRFTNVDDAKRAFKSIEEHPLLLADRRVHVVPCLQRQFKHSGSDKQMEHSSRSKPLFKSMFNQFHVLPEYDASTYGEKHSGDQSKKYRSTNYDCMTATRVLFVGNLGPDIQRNVLEDVFGSYGKIEDIDIKHIKNTAVPKSYAFVKFSNIDSAQKAKRELHNSFLGMRRCKIGFGQMDVDVQKERDSVSINSEASKLPNTSTQQWRSLVVTKIPNHFSLVDLNSILQEKFKGFGSMNINVNKTVKDETKIAFINFKYPYEAKAAFDKNSKLSLDGHHVEIAPVCKSHNKSYDIDQQIERNSELSQNSQNEVEIKEKKIDNLDSNLEYDQVSNVDTDVDENVSDVSDDKEENMKSTPNSESKTDKSKKSTSSTKYDDKEVIEEKGKKMPEPKLKLDEKATSNLFVGNLPSGTTEKELHKLFVKYGQIESVTIKRPQNNRAYAFVKYINMDSAQRSQVQMNGQMFQNHKLNVGYTKSPVTSCLWVGGLGSWLDVDTLKKELGRFGDIKKFVWPKGSNFAHVLYEDDTAAQAACHTLHFCPMGSINKRLRVDFIGDKNILTEVEERNKTDTDPEKDVVLHDDGDKMNAKSKADCEMILENEETIPSTSAISDQSVIKLDSSADKNMLTRAEERNNKGTNDPEKGDDEDTNNDKSKEDCKKVLENETILSTSAISDQSFISLDFSGDKNILNGPEEKNKKAKGGVEADDEDTYFDKSKVDCEKILENETILSTSAVSDKSFISFVSSGSLSSSSPKKRKARPNSIHSDISDESFISFISSGSLNSNITKSEKTSRSSIHSDVSHHVFPMDADGGIWAPFSPVHEALERTSDRSVCVQSNENVKDYHYHRRERHEQEHSSDRRHSLSPISRESDYYRRKSSLYKTSTDSCKTDYDRHRRSTVSREHQDSNLYRRDSFFQNRRSRSRERSTYERRYQTSSDESISRESSPEYCDKSRYMYRHSESRHGLRSHSRESSLGYSRYRYGRSRSPATRENTNYSRPFQSCSIDPAFTASQNALDFERSFQYNSAVPAFPETTGKTTVTSYQNTVSRSGSYGSVNPVTTFPNHGNIPIDATNPVNYDVRPPILHNQANPLNSLPIAANVSTSISNPMINTAYVPPMINPVPTSLRPTEHFAQGVHSRPAHFVISQAIQRIVPQRIVAPHTVPPPMVPPAVSFVGQHVQAKGAEGLYSTCQQQNSQPNQKGSVFSWHNQH